MTTYTYEEAVEMLEEGQKITRRAWENGCFIEKIDDNYFATLVSQENGLPSYQQNQIANISSFIESGLDDYLIFSN